MAATPPPQGWPLVTEAAVQCPAPPHSLRCHRDPGHTGWAGAWHTPAPGSGDSPGASTHRAMTGACPQTARMTRAVPEARGRGETSSSTPGWRKSTSQEQVNNNYDPTTLFYCCQGFEKLLTTPIWKSWIMTNYVIKPPNLLHLASWCRVSTQIHGKCKIMTSIFRSTSFIGGWGYFFSCPSFWGSSFQLLARIQKSFILKTCFLHQSQIQIFES